MRYKTNIIMKRQFKFWALALPLLLLTQSCSYIYDDCTNCSKYYSLNYRLDVVSNINVQLSDQLKADVASKTLNTLNGYFQGIMQPATTEARLGFYPADGEEPILFDRTVEGRSATVSLSIPADNYRHIAVIGQDDPSVSLVNMEKATTATLTQFQRDTVDNHTQAAFAGTLDMNVVGNADQSWVVNLYPADAGVAVVMRNNPKVSRVRAFLGGLATSFTPNDSTWHWDRSSLVRTVPVSVAGTDSTAYCAVCFPSHDKTAGAKGTATRADDGSLWHVDILVDMPNGTVTRTVLTIEKPLRAGDIRVIRVKVNDDGAISTTDSNVGASVTLDWKNGGEYNPEV